MDRMKIKFKKMNPNAVTPRQGTNGAAGFDLTAAALRLWFKVKGIEVK